LLVFFVDFREFVGLADFFGQFTNDDFGQTAHKVGVGDGVDVAAHGALDGFELDGLARVVVEVLPPAKAEACGKESDFVAVDVGLNVRTWVGASTVSDVALSLSKPETWPSSVPMVNLVAASVPLAGSYLDSCSRVALSEIPTIGIG
jgi:hypothetical protein